MRLVVDTGVFSASLDPRRAIKLVSHVKHLSGNQLFLAATTVAKRRYACRTAGHPPADRIHANDLWIAASPIRIAALVVNADKVFRDVPGGGAR